MFRLTLITAMAAATMLAAAPPQAESARSPAQRVTVASRGATAAEARAAAPVAARQTYEKRCVVCHGKEGKGDGPGGKYQKPPPPNFQDPTWQKSVTDARIRKSILRGGPAVGASPGMPAFPNLRVEVDGLVKLIRAMKR